VAHGAAARDRWYGINGRRAVALRVARLAIVGLLGTLMPMDAKQRHHHAAAASRAVYALGSRSGDAEAKFVGMLRPASQ
jgi:hypothetical protein